MNKETGIFHVDGNIADNEQTKEIAQKLEKRKGLELDVQFVKSLNVADLNSRAGAKA